MRRTTALILGGGPAGAAAAIRLAQSGMAPQLVERSAEPQDLLCGGFLSWSTVRQLRGLGVDPDRLGGHRIDRLGLFIGKRETVIKLPSPAMGLSRLRLDEAMLAQAAAAGVRIERGRTARSIDDGQVQFADGDVLRSDTVIIATGKRDLRGAKRPAFVHRTMLGLRWRLQPTSALDRLIANKVELHLFDGGYAGLVRQENDINLCLTVSQARFQAEALRPEHFLLSLLQETPALRERLDRAGSIGPAQTVANIPYGWRATELASGAMRIGDQCAVIPSLAGEGIAIAIASGEAIANAIARGSPASQFQTDFARRTRTPVAIANVIWKSLEKPGLAAFASRIVAGAPFLVGVAARLTRI